MSDAQRTLRRKPDRALLWLEADARCSRCGRELDDRWEADHCIPWVVSRRTNLFELQALCRQCNRKKGSTVVSAAQCGERRKANGRDWRSYFTLAPRFREQKGQVAAFGLAASVTPADREALRWLFRLCTGYGKTLLAYGVFWILKQRGLVDNMLVLTQSDDQRTQFAEDAREARDLLGIDVRAWVIEKKTRDLRVVRERRADVFVGTYQQLREGDNFIHDMLEYADARWMVAADECHHLSVGGLWARRQESLPCVAVRCGLSATPERHDAKKLLGLPDEPTLSLDYADAYTEKVVKRVEGQVQTYGVEIDIDGRMQIMDTDMLRAEGVTDFNKWEARRRIRYHDSYVHPMVLDALEDLRQRNLAYPGQNQMVVYCMSCQHADHVCRQINALIQEHGFAMSARWAGVGAGADGSIKSDADNRTTLEAFKKGEFEILVQVAIAQEGFNNKRVSVIAFLHLIGADPRLLQQIGRGLRRNEALPFEDDTLSVYASSDTPIAELVENMELQAAHAADAEGRKDGSGQGDEGTSPRFYDIPDLMLLDVWYERTDVVFARGTHPLTPEQEAYCRANNLRIQDVLRLFGMPLRMSPKGSAGTQRSEREALKALEGQVTWHVGRLADSLLLLQRANGLQVNGEAERKKRKGELCHRINRQWNRIAHIEHDEMLREDFDRKNRWLQEEMANIKQTREVPLWARL